MAQTSSTCDTNINFNFFHEFKYFHKCFNQLPQRKLLLAGKNSCNSFRILMFMKNCLQEKFTFQYQYIQIYKTIEFIKTRLQKIMH